MWLKMRFGELETRGLRASDQQAERASLGFVPFALFRTTFLTLIWGSLCQAQPTASLAEPFAADDHPTSRAALAQAQLANAAKQETDLESLRYTIEQIVVRGNHKTASSVVSRYVAFKAGDVLDVDDPQVQLTRYRLLGTGFFRDVNLSLEKGSRRGWVVLIVDVVERNTVVVNDLWMGLSASADTDGTQRLLSAFAGIDAAETNFLGTGINLAVATAFSKDQLAAELRFLDPAFLSTPWMLSGEILLNDALGFFGNAVVQWDDPLQTTEVLRPAVVRYDRIGANLGLGRDLSVSNLLWLNYRLETARSRPPNAAAHRYGDTVEPIDFRILPGTSVLATLSATLQHDTRDQPFLANEGSLARIGVEASLRPLGSDYEYGRIDVSASQWWKLANGHVLKTTLFLGLISGNAPFFEQYYLGDLSDLRPGRVLGLAFDDRPSPNFLNNAISEVRHGDYAAKLSAEYRVPLYRGTRSVFGIDLFFGGGLYSLASDREVSRPPRNRSGFARVPIDLTGNVGFLMDTNLGGFAFSFANALGFLPPSRGD